MSLIYDLRQIQKAIMLLEEKAESQQITFFNLVTDLVELRQEYRLLKDYETADRIRVLLSKAGIEITQGSIGLPPEKWGNLQVNDTWRYKS